MSHNRPDSTIHLRHFLAKDGAAIEKWPIYPMEFAELDYALRKDGWITEFQDKPDTWIYAAEQSGELIAFTIISMTAPWEAEFRIALRADKAGQGLGEVIIDKTLRIGFDEIGLKRINLIVRKTNRRAIELYQRLNFSYCGECHKMINSREIDFFKMEIVRMDFICGHPVV